MQKDPIGFAGQDMNLYRYVNNNPIKFTDPTGEAAENPFGDSCISAALREASACQSTVSGTFAIPKLCLTAACVATGGTGAGAPACAAGATVLNAAEEVASRACKATKRKKVRACGPGKNLTPELVL